MELSGIEFKDIASELYRTYDFGNGNEITIYAPLWLNVSKSGGHRIIDGNDASHYIPSGWIHLSWKVKPGEPAFVC